MGTSQTSMDAITEMARRIVDERTRQLAAWLMRDVPNPTHVWHGAADGRPRALHLLRLGDCSWHIIDHAHGFGRPGYPALLDERLARAGVGLGFDDCFVGSARKIHPPTLTRVARERPDAIIVHMGVGHGVLELLPLSRLNLTVARLRANRSLGRAGGWLHRHVTAPLLRRAGRPITAPCTPEETEQGFARLRGWIEQCCPGTPWAILPPHTPIRHGWADPAIVAETTDIYARAAVAQGGAFLDYRPHLAAAVRAGRTEDFYGATGYDLRRPGHVIVEQLLHEWLQAVGAIRDPGPGAQAGRVPRRPDQECAQAGGAPSVR